MKVGRKGFEEPSLHLSKVAIMTGEDVENYSRRFTATRAYEGRVFFVFSFEGRGRGGSLIVLCWYGIAVLEARSIAVVVERELDY